MPSLTPLGSLAVLGTGIWAVL